MKIQLITAIFLVLGLNSDGQDKPQNQLIKTSDTINMNFDGYLKSKIDTLYFKNLSVQKSEKEGILKQILPLLGVLLGSILGWIAQAHSKKQERFLNSSNLKEAKRIQNLEQVYTMINKLSLISPNDSMLILNDVNMLQRFLSDNNLYIDKPYEKIIQNISDYYKSVAQDFQNKNYLTEIQNADQFKNLFRK